MAVTIPPQALPLIQGLLELSDERIQEVLDAFENAGSRFNFLDLASEVSNQTKVPRRIINGISRLLVMLYRTKERQTIPLGKFLDEQVGPALKRAEKAAAEGEMKKPEEIERRWLRFRGFLMTGLALDHTVGTAAKTGPVMTEHEKVFSDARILTDVRPIFHDDISEKPKAAVIVHMLRLTTRDIFGSQKAQYFAMDANDIRFMKQLIDRAIKKEDTLKTLLHGSDIDVIVPKASF
jgi:hypothetical protein